MSQRGTQVNDPRSVVLIDNISNSSLCLPREGMNDIIFKPGETAQITWSEFIKYKSTPHFGRYIKLNDSVIIADGSVKIKNVSANLTNDVMVEMLVQNVERLKEFVLTLNDGEVKLFHNFLRTRLEIGIEEEKCKLVMSFVEKENPDILEGESLSSKEVLADPEIKEKRGPGRPRNKDVKVVENENALSAHVERTGDSE